MRDKRRARGRETLVKINNRKGFYQRRGVRGVGFIDLDKACKLRH